MSNCVRVLYLVLCVPLPVGLGGTVRAHKACRDHSHNFRHGESHCASEVHVMSCTDRKCSLLRSLGLGFRA